MYLIKQIRISVYTIHLIRKKKVIIYFKIQNGKMTASMDRHSRCIRDQIWIFCSVSRLAKLLRHRAHRIPNITHKLQRSLSHIWGWGGQCKSAKETAFAFRHIYNYYCPRNRYAVQTYSRKRARTNPTIGASWAPCSIHCVACFHYTIRYDTTCSDAELCITFL